jgi:isoquinoline 1-oxidoreductase alpha subunit
MYRRRPDSDITVGADVVGSDVIVLSAAIDPALASLAHVLVINTLGRKSCLLRTVQMELCCRPNQQACEAFARDHKREEVMARITINGQTHNIDVEPDTPLLWVIRENVGLTGTKYGCGVAQCGACTVHIDGMGAVRSCSLPVSAAEGMSITTIEGLAQNGVLHKVQQAWVAHDVPQCGYCQSGMIMAVAQLLKDKPKPTDADIDREITNICRCGTFQQVREAIHEAAKA